VLNLLLAELLLGESSGVRVEAELDLEVLERVLLLYNTALGDGSAADGAEDLLDIAGVDDLGEIGLLHDGGGQEVVLLQGRGLGGGAVDLVESRESRRRPDDEAAKVTTGGELEEVERVDRAGLNTGDVAESTDELLAILLGVDNDQRTTALLVAATPHLALTSANLLGVLGLLNVLTGTDSLEKGNGGGGLLDGAIGEGGRGDNEGNLRDSADCVAAGQQKSGRAGGGDGGGDREALLVLVDLLVPLAPDLGGSEHATGTAHVTEGGLTSAVSSTTGDTGDTGYSASGTPGLSRGLVTSLLGDSIGLNKLDLHFQLNRSVDRSPVSCS